MEDRKIGDLVEADAMKTFVTVDEVNRCSVIVPCAEP